MSIFRVTIDPLASISFIPIFSNLIFYIASVVLFLFIKMRKQSSYNANDIALESASENYSLQTTTYVDMFKERFHQIYRGNIRICVNASIISLIYIIISAKFNIYKFLDHHIENVSVKLYFDVCISIIYIYVSDKKRIFANLVFTWIIVNTIIVLRTFYKIFIITYTGVFQLPVDLYTIIFPPIIGKGLITLVTYLLFSGIMLLREQSVQNQ